MPKKGFLSFDKFFNLIFLAKVLNPVFLAHLLFPVNTFRPFRQRKEKSFCFFSDMFEVFHLVQMISFFEFINLSQWSSTGIPWKFLWVPRISEIFLLQYKPLNVITLGQTKSDNINRMITLTGCIYLVSISKWDYKEWSH